MFSVFWKSLFSLLLAVLLVVNLAYAFNIVQNVFSFAPTSIVDYSDKYLGIWDFIEFVTNEGLESSSILSGFQYVINQLSDFVQDRFTGAVWLGSNFEWWDYLLNVVSYFILPFVILINTGIYLCYMIVIAVYICLQILRFMSGGYYSTMPSYTYNVQNLALFI